MWNANGKMLKMLSGILDNICIFLASVHPKLSIIHHLKLPRNCTEKNGASNYLFMIVDIRGIKDRLLSSFFIKGISVISNEKYLTSTSLPQQMFWQLHLYNSAPNGSNNPNEYYNPFITLHNFTSTAQKNKFVNKFWIITQTKRVWLWQIILAWITLYIDRYAMRVCRWNNAYLKFVFFFVVCYWRNKLHWWKCTYIEQRNNLKLATIK